MMLLLRGTFWLIVSQLQHVRGITLLVDPFVRSLSTFISLVSPTWMSPGAVWSGWTFLSALAS